MPGHALRYDQEWYYRMPNGNWFLVNADLSPGGDPPARDRTRVTDGTILSALDGLFDAVQSGALPERLRDGLVISIPPLQGDLERAMARRPKRGQGLR